MGDPVRIRAIDMAVITITTTIDADIGATAQDSMEATILIHGPCHPLPLYATLHLLLSPFPLLSVMRRVLLQTSGSPIAPRTGPMGRRIRRAVYTVRHMRSVLEM